MKIELNANEGLGEVIVNAAKDNGFEPYFNYSGRGLVKNECFGITGNVSDIGSFFINVCMSCSKEEISDIGDCFTSVQWDSLGMDKIFYFPRLLITK